MELLAQGHERGRYGSQDFEKAVKWYRKAAVAQEATSMHALARLYEAGKGVPVNARVAAKWFAKAVEYGHEHAIGEITRKPKAWSKAFRQELQEYLRAKGFYNGKADGVVGPETIRSLKGFAG